jgi:hypothetical protein
MNHKTIEAIEHGIRRVLFPVIGLLGLAYEELSPPVDPVLVGAYLALMGFGAIPWVKDYYTRKGGGE